MLGKEQDQKICLKQYISEKEYNKINQLEGLCSLHDKTNLKLEMDHKLNMGRKSETDFKTINEFLYYADDVLVGYLGISSFGGTNIAEINGMVHPDFRRKGIFNKLFGLAIEECRKSRFKKVLLLSDGKSGSGVEFIKSVHGEYDFSEYRMKQKSSTAFESINPISLRKAVNQDGKEIMRQNAIYFGCSVEGEYFPEDEEKLNKFTYMVELQESVIGKIRIIYSGNSAFICGVGILPEFRGKGYGKATLKAALSIINEKSIPDIELDVECKNSAALNLYKDCGFEEQSVMNYYEYKP